MGTNSTPVEIMQEEKALAPREQAELEERSVDQVRNQVIKIQELMKSLLKEDQHYGTIPGTKKPTLLKPGAEKICFTFRLIPKFKITRYDMENGHREYEIVCDLHNSQSGVFLGQGVGSCSTMESKYRWRKSGRVCPNCGEEAIRRSNYPDKSTGAKGWYCNENAGGCNGKYSYNDPRIEEQQTERRENPDIADQYNTALKMAKKRAHIDATITATAASDVFAQDADDFPEHNGAAKKAEKKAEPKQNGQPEKAKDTTNGRLATQKQIKLLWVKCGKRAEVTGVIKSKIWEAVFAAIGIESSKKLPRNRVDVLVEAIENYEPPIEAEAVEGREPRSDDDKTPF